MTSIQTDLNPSTAIHSLPRCDSAAFSRRNDLSRTINNNTCHEEDKDHFDSLMDYSQFCTTRDGVNQTAQTIDPVIYSR
jgi:hypothetical protein